MWIDGFLTVREELIIVSGYLFLIYVVLAVMFLLCKHWKDVKNTDINSVLFEIIFMLFIRGINYYH
jgi:hypothetical protein